jgi:hypothetical protein
MIQEKKQQCYIGPQAQLVDIAPMSVLCQSGEGGSDFSTSLEDMTENDYIFSF